MKNYFIVGGSTGIGAALVEMLLKAGHQVFATYNRNPMEDRDRMRVCKLDVELDEADLSFLPETLDGFVYCPGSINLMPFHRTKPDAYKDDFNLQVLGAIRVLQQILPRLKASQQASVVLFSTIAVQKGFTFHTQVAVSKGAVEGLTRSLAAELAPGIRVNAVAPSLTDTPLAARLLNTPEKKAVHAGRHPLKRTGAATDPAAAAAFLLSDASGWITGQVLPVDGGLSSINI